MQAGTLVLVKPMGELPEVVAGLSQDLLLAGQTPADLAEGIAVALNGTMPLPMPEQCSLYARRRNDRSAVVQSIRNAYLEACG